MTDKQKPIINKKNTNDHPKKDIQKIDIRTTHKGENHKQLPVWDL